MRKFFYVLFLVTFLFSSINAQEDYLKRGNLAAQSNQFEKALSEYKKGLSDAGNNEAVFYYNIGVCHYQLGQTQDAVREFLTAIEKRKGDYQKAWYALGVAYLDLKDFSNAKKAFYQAIAKSNGKDAEAAFDLAMILVQEHDYKNAIVLFQNAINGGSISSIESHNNLGVMFAKTGELIRAKREFEIALKESEGRLNAALDNLRLCTKLIVSRYEATALVWKIALVNKTINTYGE